MRTRYAHQVTVVVLYNLLKRGHKDSGTNETFDDWVNITSQHSPTFAFWLLVLKYQQIIFMFIRAHRQRKLELMVSTLRKLVILFFAMDHQNYARWVPIFIRDLENLPNGIKAEFEKGHWTVTEAIIVSHPYQSIKHMRSKQEGERSWWHNRSYRES